MTFQKAEFANKRSLVLLAPEDACLRPFAGRVTYSYRLHSDLISLMQRLRGSVYLSDGAIRQSDLTACGRHVSSYDPRSWHLLIVERDRVLGCTRFRRHPNTVASSDLAVTRAPIANCCVWGEGFRAGIEAELASARRAGFSYVEIGGWALAPEVRATTEARRGVLAIYALAQLQGGALGISTATKRNGSADILRRLGGSPLRWLGAEIPAYWDENHGCSMEVLRFDSRFPNPRFVPHIAELRSAIARLPVVCPGEARWSVFSHGLFGGTSIVPETGLAALA
jgi:hypothetical protein